MTDSTFEKQPRLRIFAGPNGSGKSTIIHSIQGNPQPNGRLLDFGKYINADDIAVLLRENNFAFASYHIDKIYVSELLQFAIGEGLLTDDFVYSQLEKNLYVEGGKLLLADKEFNEQAAQIIARHLREVFLEQKQKFTFETVFSHPSNIEVIKRAANAGFKVYLYFVATESPEINKYRVQLRVRGNGHAVPPEKVESRYYRSLDLMHEAAQFAHQAYFFDNSSNEPFRLVAHFKVVNGKKVWGDVNSDGLPNWFIKYYLNKVNHH